VKYYDFADKAPTPGTLVIVEGTEPLLADRALSLLEERVVPEAARELNVERFDAASLDGFAAVESAIHSVAFLAPSRLVIVRGAQTFKVAARRELWRIAESVPNGNTLVLEDLFPPAKKTKPEPFGQLAGRTALRIDTTANPAVRARFVEEELRRAEATASRDVVAALAESELDLPTLANELAKLALRQRRITQQDIAELTLGEADPKAYKYASALVEGRTAEALGIAAELFANDARAAIPLVSALATEYGLLWELARPGGEIPARLRWRERALQPIAQRVGARRARVCFERAVRAFEAIVTGRAEDQRTVVDTLTILCARK
jgi:DNA polymerase III delta subunit